MNSARTCSPALKRCLQFFFLIQAPTIGSMAEGIRESSGQNILYFMLIGLLIFFVYQGTVLALAVARYIKASSSGKMEGSPTSGVVTIAFMVFSLLGVATIDVWSDSMLPALALSIVLSVCFWPIARTSLID